MFYALIATMPVLGIILYLTVPILFVVSGLVAGYLVVYIVSRFSGFEGLSRMQYSLDFQRGKRGKTYNEKSYRPFSHFECITQLDVLPLRMRDATGYLMLDFLRFLLHFSHYSFDNRVAAGIASKFWIRDVGFEHQFTSNEIARNS